MNDNLYNRIRSRFPADLDRPLLEWHTGKVYSYADADRASARFARFLADLGVKKGDRVAVQVDKSPEALFLYLACARAGFIYLPLNTAYKPAELEYFLTNAEPSAVVCRPEAEVIVRGIADKAGVPNLLTLDGEGVGTLTEGAAKAGETFEPAAGAGDDIAAILYSSGTTGRPKGAMLTIDNLWSNADTLTKLWGFTADDVLLHALPIFHTHGLFVASHCVLLSGARMIFLPKFDRDEVMRHLPRATAMMGVPTFYTRLLSGDDFNAEVTRNMRLFTSGSAPLLPETFATFKERTGHTILERYGMTETGMSTSNPLDGERKIGTVGPALPDVELRIIGEDGKPVAKGEAGELQVKGPNVFKGYWRMPEKTAAEFTEDGFFKTGDIAVIDEDDYVSIVGRSKDLVISGGFNVYPKEIEGFIDRFDGVVESAVIGLPHPDFGEAVAAVIVREPGSRIDADAIIEKCKGEFANFKVPKAVFFLDELPRNTMGKVQKNILRDDYKDTFKTA